LVAKTHAEGYGCLLLDYIVHVYYLLIVYSFNVCC